MKDRWTWGVVLAAALMLGACRAPNQGGPESAEPAGAPSAEASPAESMAPSPTEAEIEYDY